MDKRIDELLEQVNLKKSKLSNFPHELSGGEKRRVGIARVLSVGARFIVADEPTSALDVSIQAQVVNLLRDLQKQLGLSYLFISHDLRVVELISHKVAVMYLGKIVEMGLADRIANKASHPYTHILWSSLVEKQSRESSQTASERSGGPMGRVRFRAAGLPAAALPRAARSTSPRASRPSASILPRNRSLKDIGAATRSPAIFRCNRRIESSFQPYSHSKSLTLPELQGRRRSKIVLKLLKALCKIIH